MSLSIPMSVVYAGLAGTLLALIIATAQQKWRLRVFFLLALRLSIGWQFLFEGLHKINSHLAPETANSKKFTSEPYFKEAEGPFGPLVRKQIGDPDEQLAALLDLKDVPEELKLAHKLPAELRTPLIKKHEADLEKFMPAKPGKDWADYVERFKKAFPTVDAEKVDKLAAKARRDYVSWALGLTTRDSKVKYTTGDVPYSVPHRYQAMLNRKKDYLAQIGQRDTYLGYADPGYQKTLKEAKDDVSTARKELIADAEAVIADAKRDLGGLVAATLAEKAQSPSELAAKDPAVIDHWLPAAGGKGGWDVVPAPLKQVWDTYPAVYKDLYFGNPSIDPGKAAAITPKLDEAKQRLNDVYELAKIRLGNYLSDLDDYTGKPKPQFGKLADAVRKMPTDLAAKDALLKALDGKFAEMKASLTTAVTSVLTTATVPADTASNLTGGLLPDIKPKTQLQLMDEFTMWFIAVVGAFILFGFLTRLSCLAAAGFLLITYLTHPPFPWLTLPPGTEGNPLFINKNAIEFFALLALASLPTGKWLGLDALLAYLFGGKKRKTTADE